jgi:hypothetical protein
MAGTALDELEALKDAGAGRPAPEGIVQLYHEAFRSFGAEALWNRSPSPDPRITQALVVADCLRRQGGMRARPLAGRIEAASRAAL